MIKAEQEKQLVLSPQELIEVHRNLSEALEIVSSGLIRHLGDTAVGDIQIDLVDLEDTAERARNASGDLLRLVRKLGYEASPVLEMPIENDPFDRAKVLEILSDADGNMQLGDIIESYFGRRGVEDDLFFSFRTWLDDLGRARVIYHRGKSPFFGLMIDEAPAAEATPAATTPSSDDGVNQGAGEGSGDDSDDEPDEPIVLTALEQATFAYANGRELWRMEVMRREQPGVIELPKEEYDEFKFGFEKTRARIGQWLTETTGDAVTWEIYGKARGKKYALITGDVEVLEANLRTSERGYEEPIWRPKASASARLAQPASPASDTDAQTHGRRRAPRSATGAVTERARYYDQLHAQAGGANAVAGESEQNLDSATLRQLSRIMLGVMHIVRTQEAGQDSGVKWTVVAKNVAEVLGIDVEDARKFVRNMETSNDLMYAGHDSGTRLVTVDADKAQERPQKKAAGAENAAQKEERLRVESLADEYQFPILTAMGRLQPEQSIFKTTIIANIEGLDVEDVNNVCAVLEARGLVWPKKELVRGRSESRKGKTWGITPKGLELLAAERVTRADRKALIENAVAGY